MRRFALSPFGAPVKAGLRQRQQPGTDRRSENLEQPNTLDRTRMERWRVGLVSFNGKPQATVYPADAVACGLPLNEKLYQNQPKLRR